MDTPASTAARLCEQFEVVDGEVTADSVDENLDAGRIKPARTMQRLGYFGTCDACTKLMNVTPGDKLRRPVGCLALAEQIGTTPPPPLPFQRSGGAAA